MAARSQSDRHPGGCLPERPAQADDAGDARGAAAAGTGPGLGAPGRECGAGARHRAQCHRCTAQDAGPQVPQARTQAPAAAGAAVPPLRAALCVKSVAWKRHGRLPPGASAECCSAAEGPRWLHGPAPGVLLSGRATLQRPRPGRSHARDTLETGFRSSTRVSGGR